MPIDFGDLPRDSTGGLILHHVTSYVTGSADENVVIMGLGHSNAPGTPERVMTFVLHPDQAAALADSLQRHVTRIRGQKTPTRLHLS